MVRCVVVLVDKEAADASHSRPIQCPSEGSRFRVLDGSTPLVFTHPLNHGGDAKLACPSTSQTREHGHVNVTQAVISHDARDT